MTDTKPTDLSLTGCAPLTIGMVLYPGFTLLDLAGPQNVGVRRFGDSGHGRATGRLSRSHALEFL